jgi:branched-chain amino acid transport system substrate-binding protein
MARSAILKGRRRALKQAGALLASLSVPSFALAVEPVMIGLDAEFGLESSLSAQAVELGLRTALAQINANGGVLGGRPLELITKDHRSIPARGIKNLKDLAANPNLVAVFGARFSPVVIEELPTIKELKLPFMAVWSSADPIVDNGMQPNYVFRLSLRDSLAMPKMLVSAKQRGFNKIGLLLTNTAWGRSNLAAAEKYVANAPQSKIVQTVWYNWKDTTFQLQYDKLLAAGAEALLVVGNDDEIALFVREMAARPPAQRLPVFSHWGITGGEFAKQAGNALNEVDLTVIQTFSFYTADKTVLPQFMKYLGQVSGIRSIDEIRAPVGVAHAYDMAHILARAINLAGSTERGKIRDALEKVPEHRGLIKLYRPPFTPTRHEALGPDELLMVRFDKSGVLLPAQK